MTRYGQGTCPVCGKQVASHKDGSAVLPQIIRGLEGMTLLDNVRNGNALGRYVGAYERVRYQRAEEEARKAVTAAQKEADRCQKLREQLDTFIPEDLLRDFELIFLPDRDEWGNREGPEIILRPWFMVGVDVMVTVGTGYWYGRRTGYWYGRHAVRLYRKRSGIRTEEWIDHGDTREVVEEKLATVLLDHREPLGDGENVKQVRGA